MVGVAGVAEQDQVAHSIIGGVAVAMVDLKTIIRPAPAADAVALAHATA
jgi:Holliday junction resolvasome RuvABC endonuclease subunit